MAGLENVFVGMYPRLLMLIVINNSKAGQSAVYVEQRLHSGDEQVFDDAFLCWVNAETRGQRHKLTIDNRLH